MKKAVTLLCLFLAVTLLTACTKTVYKPQPNLSFNYNNLSAGDAGYWLDSDVMLYNELFENEYRVAMKTASQTFQLSKKDPWYFSTMQKHGNLVYYATDKDISNPESNLAQLNVYNLTSKSETLLLEVQSLIQFYVCEDKLYVVREQEYFDTYRYVAEFYDLESLTPLGKMENLYAFGVQGNRPLGIVTDTRQCKIMEWDFSLISSKEIGSFAITENQNTTLYDGVNTTEEYLIMYTIPTYQNISQILLYNLKTNTLDTVDVEGEIAEIIAYNNHAFFSAWGNEDDLNLYSLSIPQKAVKPLGKIHEDKSLFVTSDEDVYLCSFSETDVVHYRLDGTKESVLKQVAQ